jgi:hypothetical protein
MQELTALELPLFHLASAEVAILDAQILELLFHNKRWVLRASLRLLQLKLPAVFQGHLIV